MSRRSFIDYAVRAHGLSSIDVGRYCDQAEGMTRTVVEERPRPFREFDVFSLLAQQRIVFLGEEVKDYICNILIAQFLFFDESGSEDIQLYINSPGGSVYAGMGVYDTMQYLNSDVATTCIGLAASMAAVLLGGGASDKRSALPHSRVMIHQPIGGVRGQASDMEISAREIKRVKKELIGIIAKHAGQSYQAVEKDADRDHWMTAQESLEYGLIDHILAKK